MKTTKLALSAALLLLAGCASAPPEHESDPVIAGQRYAGGAPINLGAVAMRLTLRESAPAQDGERGPENARLSLAFLATGDSARVVVGGSTLRYGERVAELVTRQQAQGTAQGCGEAGGAMLALDYWFAASVTAEAWTCVTLAFVTPGRRADEALELRLGTLNVDGEPVHALPVTFVPRAD